MNRCTIDEIPQKYYFVHNSGCIFQRKIFQRIQPIVNSFKFCSKLHFEICKLRQSCHLDPGAISYSVLKNPESKQEGERRGMWGVRGSIAHTSNV